MSSCQQSLTRRFKVVENAYALGPRTPVVRFKQYVLNFKRTIIDFSLAGVMVNLTIRRH